MRKNSRIIFLLLIVFIVYLIKDSFKLNSSNKIISQNYETSELINDSEEEFEDRRKRKLPEAIIIGGK